MVTALIKLRRAAAIIPLTLQPYGPDPGAAAYIVASFSFFNGYMDHWEVQERLFTMFNELQHNYGLEKNSDQDQASLARKSNQSAKSFLESCHEMTQCIDEVFVLLESKLKASCFEKSDQELTYYTSTAILWAREKGGDVEAFLRQPWSPTAASAGEGIPPPPPPPPESRPPPCRRKPQILQMRSKCPSVCKVSSQTSSQASSSGAGASLHKSSQASSSGAGASSQMSSKASSSGAGAKPVLVAKDGEGEAAIARTSRVSRPVN